MTEKQARFQLDKIMQQKTVSISRLKKVLSVIDKENERKTKNRQKHLTALQTRIERQRKLLGGLQRDVPQDDMHRV